MQPPKVLFVWDDGDLRDVDLSQPERGNIGIGGTDFLFGSIPHELGKRMPIGTDWRSLFRELQEGRAPRKPSIVRPTGLYPHGWLHRRNFLGARSQSARDLADKIVDGA